MKFLLFISLFICHYSFSQIESALLISKGTIPSFINQQSSFVERVPLKQETDAMDHFKNTDIILEQVLNSGKIVFGEELCKYAQGIADKVTENYKTVEITVYIVKTNKALTFSSKPGNLFISTGLISQVSNENQLAYFIAREIEVIAANLNDLKKKKSATQSFDDKIELLTSFDEITTKTIDSLGALRYLKSNYKSSEILSAFDVLTYAYMPFEQIDVPYDYFNTDQFYIPTEFFDVYGEKGDIPLSNSFLFKDFEAKILKRKERLGLLFNLTKSGEKIINSNEFLEIRNLCRYESVRQDIIGGKYNDAIYNIFILEQLNGSSPYLDKLKAHAWLGLTSQETGSSKRWEKLKYQDVRGESSKFLFTLRKLNANGVSAFSIRIIYDLKEKYKSAEYDLIWNNLMEILSINPFFQIEKFSGSTYQTALENFNANKSISDSLDNKYDKINSVKNNAKTDQFDLSEFYLYGIADLISNGPLINELNHHKSNLEQTIPENSVLEIHPSIQFRKYSGKLNTKKSRSFLQNMNKSISKISSDLKLNIDTNNLDYFMFSIIKETFTQSFINSDYNSKLIPLYNEEIKSISTNSDFLCFTFFESYYRPKLRPYHWIGLTVFALPVVIPDIFMKSFQTKQATLIFDTKTGAIISSDYTKYFEPLTKRLMKNRIFYSLPNTKQQ
jgi:hypothetical protein